MSWLAAVLVVSVVVALLRGGRLSNLTDLSIRAWWLVPIAFAVQASGSLVPSDREWSRALGVSLLVGSYLLLLIAVWLNRAEPGMWIAGIGILMNFSVIAANGGMPVLEEAVILAGGEPGFALDAKHVLLDDGSRLVFLADVIPLPGSVVSLGDVFLGIGLGVFLEDQLRRPIQLFRHGVKGVPGSAAGN